MYRSQRRINSKLQRYKPHSNYQLDAQVEALTHSFAEPKTRSLLLHEISHAYAIAQSLNAVILFATVPEMMAQVDPPVGITGGLSGNQKLSAILGWLKS